MNNIREIEASESRTLAKFIRDKLRIHLKEFARRENIPVSTLYDRWKSRGGRIQVMDAVFRQYVEQYHKL